MKKHNNFAQSNLFQSSNPPPARVRRPSRKKKTGSRFSKKRLRAASPFVQRQIFSAPDQAAPAPAEKKSLKAPARQSKKLAAEQTSLKKTPPDKKKRAAEKPVCLKTAFAAARKRCKAYIGPAQSAGTGKALPEKSRSLKAAQDDGLAAPPPARLPQAEKEKLAAEKRPAPTVLPFIERHRKRQAEKLAAPAGGSQKPPKPAEAPPPAPAPAPSPAPSPAMRTLLESRIKRTSILKKAGAKPAFKSNGKPAFDRTLSISDPAEKPRSLKSRSAPPQTAAPESPPPALKPKKIEDGRQAPAALQSAIAAGRVRLGTSQGMSYKEQFKKPSGPLAGRPAPNKRELKLYEVNRLKKLSALKVTFVSIKWLEAMIKLLGDWNTPLAVRSAEAMKWLQSLKTKKARPGTVPIPINELKALFKALKLNSLQRTEAIRSYLIAALRAQEKEKFLKNKSFKERGWNFNKGFGLNTAWGRKRWPARNMIFLLKIKKELEKLNWIIFHSFKEADFKAKEILFVSLNRWTALDPKKAIRFKKNSRAPPGLLQWI